MDNFNILVAGGFQDEDLVSDGWTDIIRNLGARRVRESVRWAARRGAREDGWNWPISRR